MQSQSSPYMDASNMYRSFQDANIPFPRTSGAKFSGAGKYLKNAKQSLFNFKSQQIIKINKLVPYLFCCKGPLEIFYE